MENWVKVWAAGAAGVLSYMFGAWDGLIIALICFVVTDYVSGVIRAAAQKELSSAVGFKGLAKKVLIFLVVGVATILDKVIPAVNGALRAAVIMFYLANEGISILENAAEIGLPVPKIIADKLKQVKEDAEKKEEENGKS